MKLSIALAFLLSLFALPALAGNVTLKWEAPTSCDDGSAVSNCPTTGYQIFMGTSLTGTAYGQRAESPAATDLEITLVNVPAGDRCFFMKTKSNALVSGESNRLCVNVPASGPRSPRITTVVVVTLP